MKRIRKSSVMAQLLAVALFLMISVNAVASTTNESFLTLVPLKATEPVDSTEPVKEETTPVTEPIETEPVETVPKETVPTAHEDYMGVPYYFQTDYPDTPYGKFGTVSTHGCGITSLAMVATYLLDEELPPDVLAERYGDEYNTKVGSK